jgi:tetraacyldisaccharide 4'-kinase
MKLFFFPFMVIFYIVVYFRNLLFDIGILKVRRFSVPVISVGNLSVGGTGKTPHVKKIVELLQKHKKRVSIVSRGYGGNYGGYATRVIAEKDAAASLYGDEPVFFAKNLSVPVYVAHERSAAVELCINNEHPDIVVSDDGFQHRWMGRAVDVVLIDATDENCWMLPVGRYREPLSSLKRARYVFLTKGNLASAKTKSQWYERLERIGFSRAKKNLFVSDYTIHSIELFRGVEPLVNSAKVFLACSIARPESFYRLVNQGQVVEQFISKDHYIWTQNDIDAMEVRALDRGVKDLLITEKDAVKMESLVFRYLQVHVVKMELKVEPELTYEAFV